MKNNAIVPLLLSLSTSLLLVSAARAAQEVFAEADAEVKQGPGTQFNAVGQVRQGMWLTAASRPLDGYFKVRTTSGEVGWLPSEAIAPAREGSTRSVNGETELRSKPESKAPVLTKLPDGATVVAGLSIVDGHCAVRTPEGRNGWVNAEELVVRGRIIDGPAAELRQKPDKKARVVGHVGPGAGIDVVALPRKGFFRVVGSRRGWIPVLAVRFTP